MADIAAPYTTASEINSQAGDPNLSGAAVNFDPAVKAPLQPIQDTFNRIDAENFQRQEQLQRQKHDILTRQMEMDHQDKVLKYQQSLKEREALFNFFNKNPGVSSANLKDSDGNDMSIPFLPQDQKEIDTANDNLRKKAFSDVGGFFYGPDFPKDNQDLNTKKRNASIKSIYATQARQLLQTADDPKERQRINDYLDDLQDHPLTDIPHPFVKLPTTSPLIDTAKYKDPKTLESFDQGEGVPNSEYVNILNTTDPKILSEGFKRLNFYKTQPQGQDAQQYTEFQNLVNKIAKQRGIPQVDLGGSLTQDGKVIFPDNTYKGQQTLARKMAYATELVNNGYLRNPDEEDIQKQQKIAAETRKDIAEASLKEKEFREGKQFKPTAESLKEEQTKKEVKGIYDDVQEVYNTSGKKEAHPLYTSWWNKNGIDPGEYNFYQVDKNQVRKYIGVEEPVVTTKNTDKGTIKKTVVGDSIHPDHAYLLQNKETNQKELVFTKGDDVVARVPDKEAVINHIKHEAKYQPKIYNNKLAAVDEVYNNSGNIEKPTAEAIETPTEGDKKMDNGKKMIYIGGAWKTVVGKDNSGKYVFE